MTAVADLLFLVHRLPYPPNKGDKVRSFHLLRHLSARHRVFLGTFIDDAMDEAHVDTVRSMCGGLHVSRIHPGLMRVRSLRGLIEGEALSLAYYRNAELSQWVSDTMQRHGIKTAVVFSSSMAQYVEHCPGVNVLVDFVDVDSAKWQHYAESRRWPLSWLYRREGDRLLAYERTVAKRATRSFFVSARETALFQALAPECADRVETMGNGVDTNYFAADPRRVSPFAHHEIALVFTGAMDYWPNVDAVVWFAREVLPRLRKTWPRLRLHVVGREPTAAVRALAGKGVSVTGTVPDVRPFLQHAAIVVAPMRLARGVQNKILEAMAMGRPVVASRVSSESIDATEGVELLAAAGPDEFAFQIETLLNSSARAAAIGKAARQRVVSDYSWTARLARIGSYLADEPCGAAA
jgi:polysaccharide biosynthesis protein PslH